MEKRAYTSLQKEKVKPETNYVNVNDSPACSLYGEPITNLSQNYPRDNLRCGTQQNKLSSEALQR